MKQMRNAKIIYIYILFAQFNFEIHYRPKYEYHNSKPVITKKKSS